MRAFWETAEKIDTAAFQLLDRLRKIRGQASFRKDAETRVEQVRPPQPAIVFDN